ncbi:hypothetical protein VB636_09190, partial [Paracoccus sp. APAP_BH8]
GDFGTVQKMVHRPHRSLDTPGCYQREIGLDQLGAQPLDVKGGARDEMAQLLDRLGRAATLELARQGAVEISQAGTFAPISIRRRPE